MIQGVLRKKLIVHKDCRGDFREIIRESEGIMPQIKQISVGRTLPGIIKAFHWHKKQDDIFYVFNGNIQLVLYDQRENSPTYGKIQEILLGKSFDPEIIFIPRGVLHGYKTLEGKEAEVLYLTNNEYNSLDPDEQRVAHDDPSIGFDWGHISRPKQKLVVIGASGFLGRELVKDLQGSFEVIGTYKEHPSSGLIFLDITDADQVGAFFKEHSPDIVVLASAMTNVENCELSPSQANKINVEGVRNIVSQNPKKFVYISTDSVFDGSSSEYFEEDIACPLDVYGRTKFTAEEIVKELPGSLVVRTSRLYGPKGNKFLNNITETLFKGGKIKVPEGTKGNFTFVMDASKAINDLINLDCSGIYHVAGDAYSFDEVGKECLSLLNLPKSHLEIVDKEYFGSNVKRPQVVLNTDKLKRKGIKMRPLKEGLNLLISDLERSKNYTELKECRICKSKNLVPYLDLGDMPLVNSYLRPEEIKKEVKYPLKVLLCKDCFFSQLSIVVDPSVLFREYAYRSSISTFFQNHCKELALELNSRYCVENDLVVDIASNDGCLLKPFKEKGNQVLGVDPAVNLAEFANSQGIPTLAEFWDERFAKKVEEDYGKAKIITAFNVFAHVDDIHSFVKGVKQLLAKDGFFIIESPHLLDLIKHNEFDTIYHEHLSYLLLKPLQQLMKNYGLKISRVKKYPIHGGSVRIYVEHDSMSREDGSYERILSEEEAEGLYREKAYFEFKEKVERVKTDLTSQINQLKKQGKTVSCFGASAKGSILLNYCGLNNNQIDFIFDHTPEKQNKFSPGTHIPIISPGFLLEKKPDYLLLTAWNFAKEIIEKTKDYKLNGGKYIVPIPKVEII